MIVSSKPILLFDIGGSHISAGVRAAEGCSVSRMVRVPLPEERTPISFVEALARAAFAVDPDLQEFGGAAVSVAGPFDFAQGISYMTHKLEYLYEYDLKGAIASKFGLPVEDVRFVSDADAFLIGEIAAGAAQDATRVVGLTLGTGTGSAFAVDGQIILPGSGCPVWREIWDLPYDKALAEDFLSTRAVQTSYELMSGTRLEVREIAELAHTDSAAKQAFAELGVHLGAVIRSIVAPYRPDVIVVGGGIAHSASLFLPSAISMITHLETDLKVSHLLDEAQLVGAGVRCFPMSESS